MSDYLNTKLTIWLVIFWTILTIFTQMFSDYLIGSNLVGMDINCMKPGQTCPYISNEDDNILTTYYQTATNTIFNVINQVPVLNLFTPIGRMIFMTYPTEVHPFLSILLSMITILTGISVYQMGTELIP